MSVKKIDAIPSKHLDLLKDFFVTTDTLYYVGTVNLEWNKILKTIREDPAGRCADTLDRPRQSNERANSREEERRGKKEERNASSSIILVISFTSSFSYMVFAFSVLPIYLSSLIVSLFACFSEFWENGGWDFLSTEDNLNDEEGQEEGGEGSDEVDDDGGASKKKKKGKKKKGMTCLFCVLFFAFRLIIDLHVSAIIVPSCLPSSLILHPPSPLSCFRSSSPWPPLSSLCNLLQKE